MPEAVDRVLLEWAMRIADGLPVDWSSSEATDPALAPISEEMKTLELLAGGGRVVAPRLAGFTIDRELGRGGSGVVFRARDERLDRWIAVKVLPDEVALDARRLARVEQEAKLLASLNHPNIATIHGLVADERGSHVLLLEWIEGHSLAERLSAGPMTLSEALGIGRQIAEALAAAHEGGIVHRDLKPGNVMIGPHGRVKVLDFGLARRPAHEAAESDAVVAGTWAYVAPERLTGEEDHRADVFALGCVLFECLTGTRAFPGSAADEILAAVMTRAPDFSLLPAETPEAVRALLASCLTKDPALRLGRAEQACLVLEQALGERGDARASAHAVVPGLPAMPSSFVGRTEELSEGGRALEDARLVTWIGSGGSGKTRLAVELARRLHARYDAVVFVDLTPLEDDARVADAVASALDLREEGGRDAVERVVDRLRGERTLLVLDNCERVLSGAGRLAAIVLAECPGVRVLATSRQALGLESERRLHVAPMRVPGAEVEDATALATADAVRLFLDRAREAAPSLVADREVVTAAAEIARRVDGLPLAIELAAARARVLSPREIAQRLDRPLGLLRRAGESSGDRHETMRATIAWSVEALEPRERERFETLAVFVGGWDAEAANAVCDVEDEFEVLDLLSTLADKSLLVVEPIRGGATRYRLLEPIRQYGLERLGVRADEVALRRRHRAHFVSLAERSSKLTYGPDQVAWLERLTKDLDNFGTALADAERDPAGAEDALRLVGSLHRLWSVRGQARLGAAACRRALLRAHEGVPARVHGRALYALARLLGNAMGDRAEIASALERALERFREAGERLQSAHCLVALGMEAGRSHDYATARARFVEALAIDREIGHAEGVSAVLNNLGVVQWMQGDLPAALDSIREAQSLRANNADRTNEAIRAVSIAFLSMRTGRVAEARDSILDALSHYERVSARDGNAAGVILCAAEYMLERGGCVSAARLYGMEDRMLQVVQGDARTSDPPWDRRAESLGRLEAALGRSGLEAALEEGRRIPLESALSRARELVAGTGQRA